MAIEWSEELIRARDGTEQMFEVGQIRVPELHGEPSPEIALTFARIRAQEPAEASPVVFLSGGPGDGAIQWATHGPFLRVFQRVARRCDVILLDQRGAGRSERNLTVGTPTLEPESLASESGMWQLVRDHIGAAAERYRNEGAQLQGYTAVQSAHDLMALRQALDAPQLNLWGYSYGTHLSQIATGLFPDRIERVALCGFEGPDQTNKYPANLDAQLRRIDHLYAGFLDSLQTALKELDREPIELTSGIRFGGFALRHLVTHWCGISNRFTRLPAIAEGLSRRNPGELERNFRDYMRLWERPLTFYLTDAASGATHLRWKAIRAEEEHSILGSAVNFPFPRIGALIGSGDMGDDRRNPLTSDVPFLIVTGSLDGFTPTENAVEGMVTLSRANQILIQGAAHNDLLGSPTVVEEIADFFAHGDAPAVETVTLGQ